MIPVRAIYYITARNTVVRLSHSERQTLTRGVLNLKDSVCLFVETNFTDGRRLCK